MNNSQELKQKILKVTSASFENVAMAVFYFQYKNCEVYKQYVDNLGRKIEDITTIYQIPFLPIEFFKTQKLISQNAKGEAIFESSGTTGNNTSKHFVQDLEFYKTNSLAIFEAQFGPITDYHLFALLPSYLERNNSSLVFMVNHFIEKSKSTFSEFYLDTYDDLYKNIESALSNTNNKRKILLWGVTFGLLDFAEANFDFSKLNKMGELIVMDTGGMKGRKKEIIREEIENTLCKAFEIENLHSEYGMTELLSQAYSMANGEFILPNTMKIILRETNDPFAYIANESNKTGGINIIDLANVDSCSFIETMDLGQYVKSKNGFKVIGRFDNADLRGCNLLVV